MTSPLTNLGLSIPVIAAPMAGGATTPAMVIAAARAGGIGFLGAGCIIQQGAHITGLTSAATIWVVAAIGLIAGAGFPLLALIAALMVLATLVVLAPLEERLFHPSHSDDFHNGEKK